MKVKLLIALLVIVVIGLGVLFAMKMGIIPGVEKGNVTTYSEEKNENNDAINVNLEDKKEPQSKYAGDKRTIAVMIDNVGDAIPQTSLNDAMLVYEITVEGGLTRFMAVYKDTSNIKDIGPARSARPYFLDYAMENDSIYIHYGGSPLALSQIPQLSIDDIDGIESPGKVFWRTNKKAAPHNAIVSVQEMNKYIESKKYRTTTKKRNVLNYSVQEVELTSGTIANTVNVPYSTSKVKFVYNSEKKMYDRYVGNKIQKDWISGEALTTKNIIITYAHNYTTNEEEGKAGRQALENIGKLNGYYITDGKAIKITCEKTTRSGPTTYKDLEGNEIKVNDGHTYIQIVPKDIQVTFE